MDISSLKKKAFEFKKQATETLNSGIEKWIEKIEKSSFVISEEKNLEKVIQETQHQENSYGKISRKKTIIIFASAGSPFYKHLLSYIAPIIYTKSWTQNISVKICNIDISKISQYGVTESPSLLVFSDTKIVKVVHGKENIEKVVKNTNVDINYLIDNL